MSIFSQIKHSINVQLCRIFGHSIAVYPVLKTNSLAKIRAALSKKPRPRIVAMSNRGDLELHHCNRCGFWEITKI